MDKVIIAYLETNNQYRNNNTVVQISHNLNKDCKFVNMVLENLFKENKVQRINLQTQKTFNNGHYIKNDKDKMIKIPPMKKYPSPLYSYYIEENKNE